MCVPQAGLVKYLSDKKLSLMENLEKHMRKVIRNNRRNNSKERLENAVPKRSKSIRKICY